MATVDERLNAYFEWYAKAENCTIEEAKEATREEWGENGLRGYAIFGNGDGFDDVECICRIDEMNIYDGDIDAAKQAAKDGIKLIPWKEQPKCYPFKYYRFIDTPENRKALEREVKKWKEA